jgi:hypothetical protein
LDLDPFSARALSGPPGRLEELEEEVDVDVVGEETDEEGE